MPKVTYILPDGQAVVIERAEGSLMSAAVDNNLTGIDGDCGGVGSCGTCHVCIDPAWADRVGPATNVEKDMLECDAAATTTSRLGCQVEITPDLDGLVVRVVGR